MTVPVMPGEDLPPTKLDDARADLFAALELVWTSLGWPAAAASPRPPKRLTPPGAWVDVPVLHQSPTAESRAMSATFPVVFVTDGDSDQQVKLQDKLLAYGWHQLAAVKVAGHRTIVQSGGPEDVDVGGAIVRGLVFRVQVPLQTQTLCPQPLVQDNDEQEQ
jgi:hypothetical protein